MAHRRSFRSGSTSQSQRRKKSWFSISSYAPGDDLAAIALTPPDLVAPGNSLTLLALDGAGTAPSLLESTILRMRGMVDVPKSIINDNAGSTDITAVGIGFVTNEAAEAGAVPNPATVNGAEWDGWMFLRSSTQPSIDAASTHMDVKAMRKWQTGQSLVIVAGAATARAAGFTTDAVRMVLRVLFLLP